MLSRFVDSYSSFFLAAEKAEMNQRHLFCSVDSEIIVSQCDQGVGGVEIYRHFLHPDLHHQQRQNRLPQREATAEAWKGRHQHL